MTENQKLREALSELIEAYNRAGPELSRAERAVDRMRLIAAHEALALPTADHIPDAGEMVDDHLPDAGKMIETAAPVGELPELPEAYGYFDIRGSAADGYTADQMRAYARAALSAGDAVDAKRYRWLREQHWSNSDVCCVNKPKQNVRLGGTCPSGYLLDSVIDAAMRKGQL